MAKAKKIEKAELENINEQQNKMNQLLRSLGLLDVQKNNIRSNVQILSDQIDLVKKELEEKYGNINIDLADGSYTEIEKEDCVDCNDKKDAK